MMMKDKEKPLVETHTLAYGHPGRTLGRNINLTVSTGEVLCVLGPNGGGKTTLFLTLLGLLPAHEGSISLRGKPLQDCTPVECARAMAYVPQAGNSYFAFTVRDVVLMGRKTLEHALKMFQSKGKAKNPYQGMETYLFSRSLKESGVDGIELVSGNLKEFVANLKKKDGKNIWLSGGGELAKSFLDKNLVDEISLGVTPILLGSGLPLFPELVREVPLRFVSCNICRHKKEDNAMLELLYEVKK